MGFFVSNLPNLHHLLHHLPTNGAVMVLHLPRTLLTRGEMPTGQEDRINLTLPAYMTEEVFLVRVLKLHDSLAKTFPLFEFARVDIAMFDVFHATLTIGLVGRPFALVAISIGIVHGALATFAAGDEIAIISISRRSNQDSVAVGPAAFEGMRSVTVTEIGAVRFLTEVRGVVETAEEQEKVNRISTFTFSLERRDCPWATGRENGTGPSR